MGDSHIDLTPEISRLSTHTMSVVNSLARNKINKRLDDLTDNTITVEEILNPTEQVQAKKIKSKLNLFK